MQRFWKVVRNGKLWHLEDSISILRLMCGFTLLSHWLGCVWYTVVETGTTGIEAYLLPVTGEEGEGGELDLSLEYKWVLSLYTATCMLLGSYYAVSDDIWEWWVHIAALLIGAILQGVEGRQSGSFHSYSCQSEVLHYSFFIT
jgi:hypothetical protein